MPDEKRQGKKRGRPALPLNEVKKAPLNMRTTPEVRNRLEAAAAQTGRSLTHEVEFRLERSFLFEDALSLISADTKTSNFNRDLLNAKRLVELTMGNSAWEDYETWLSWRDAVLALIEIYQPTKGKSLNELKNTSVGD
tara:strand:- start:38 stop:451 length:414 start_codon:yes stop_codon:yes gene_type:complete